MKQETNNEMDLLLRRLSRGASDSRNDEGHLDADELNSYAENVLPAAARARYTEHLAECGSCRKLVAQLSSSAGVVSAVETAKVSQPSALRTFLASLFSPMVLRYAVPALALIVVAVIGLTVWRRDERAASVAQLERKAPAVPSEPIQSPSPDSFQDRQEKAATTKTQTQVDQAKDSTVAPAPAAPPSVSAPTDAIQEAPPPKADQQAANASAQATPTPGTATDETRKEVKVEAAKPTGQGRVVSELPVRGQDYESAKREDRRAGEVETARAPAPAAGAGSIAKLQVGIDEKDKNEAETRSVAGRRFRKERGIWIDTAYDSPRATVTLTRGSEQYRALVADEPAIKTIADQLGGEIIVVWKGRAYRIR